jgi:hypothetical protein
MIILAPSALIEVEAIAAADPDGSTVLFDKKATKHSELPVRAKTEQGRSCRTHI